MSIYIAYKGSKFTIEWYVDSRGYSQAYDYYEQQTEAEQDKLLALFAWMGNTGLIKNKEKFNHEGDGIYAFKPYQDRYLCFFFKGGKIIVTNAFFKQSQKLPPKEKEKALVAEKSYIKRVSEGTYYEEEN